MAAPRMTRRAVLLTAGIGAPAWAQSRPTPDLPGEEGPAQAKLPQPLSDWLPPARLSPFEPPPRSQGWSGFALSPLGTRVLCVQDLPGRRAVHLLAEDGEPLRDMSSQRFAYAGASWGPDDATIFLEGSQALHGPREYARVDLAGERRLPWRLEALPLWSGTGRDYLVTLPDGESPAGGTPLPERFQRYTLAGQAVGAPLPGFLQSWSPDGRWLAFVRNPRRSPPGSLPEFCLAPARGDTLRVLLTSAAAGRLLEEQDLRTDLAAGGVAWSPEGDSLIAFLVERSADPRAKALIRIDRMTGRRVAAPPAIEGFSLLAVAAGGRHWLVQIEERRYRVEFGDDPG